MGRSFLIGHVQGIELRIHPSFALVVAWVAWHWLRGADRSLVPLVYAAIVVVLLFGSVLLHELGHSIMAQHYGVRVHDITLLPIGGVARLERVPTSASAEAWISLAGPSVNIAIAVALFPALLFVGIVTGLDGLGDYVALLDDVNFAGLLAYVFAMNLMLVIFNLLPAFPMDGGRVFRALLSTFMGRERATRMAVIVGQIAAFCMVVVGIWQTDWILPLVGVFVIVAAYAEGRVVRLESAMRRLHVGQFALWDMGGVAPDMPLTYALRGGPRDVVVTDGTRVVGILWRSEVLRLLNGGAGGTKVSDVMDANVVCVEVTDSVYDVQQLMHTHNRWAFAVIEKGQYRGIFTGDRFAYVYRYLNDQSVVARGSTAVLGMVTNVFRAWGR